MSEFEAFNLETNQWEILPLSKLMEVKNNPKKYGVVIVREDEI